MVELVPNSPLTYIMTSMDQSVRRELPMPAATKAGNIEQAQATLYLCAIKLRSRVDLWSGRSAGGLHNAFNAEGRQFKAWLDNWETAFSTLLSTTMPSMNPEDVDRCRVLKANHLSCIILTSLLENGSTRSEAIDRDCLAIVSLSSAVLAGQAVQVRGTKNAMSMAEPLVVVQSHCGSATLRDHAAHLLARHFNNNSQQETRPALSISPSSSVTTSSPRSALSVSFGHSRTSSQSRYNG